MTEPEGAGTRAARSLNYVSIVAKNLEESVRFYEEVFGLERIPTPNFGYAVQWLRVGDLQLHIFERPEEARRSAHFALTVDDLLTVYEKARARGCSDGETFAHHLVQLPSGNVPLDARDPAGNLIEVDWPDLASLPAELQVQCVWLEGRYPQSVWNRQATLFLEPRTATCVPVALGHPLVEAVSLRADVSQQARHSRDEERNLAPVPRSRRLDHCSLGTRPRPRACAPLTELPRRVCGPSADVRAPHEPARRPLAPRRHRSRSVLHVRPVVPPRATIAVPRP